MKQLLFLLVFVPFISFCQALDLGDIIKIENTVVDDQNKELYVFYSDSIAVFDLTEYRKTTGFALIPPLDNFYQAYNPVSAGSEIYFIERLGGKVYLLKENKLVRIDNSFTHKMQVRSTLISHNDTIFRYGGYGFWSLRNFFTYFKDSNKEWEILPPSGSDVFPPGLMLSTVKTIDDDFYVFGGMTYKEANPNESVVNDEVWRLNRENNSWELIGHTDFNPTLFKTTISYGKDHVFMHQDKDEIYRVDLVNNKLEAYQKNFIHRKIIPIFNPFYLNGRFYLFVYRSSSSSDVQLTALSEAEFFGGQVAADSFYTNNDTILYFFVFILLALLAVLIFFQIKKMKIRRKRILVKQGQLTFRGRSLDFDEKAIEVINLLLRSEEEVQYKDIFDITENKNLNYAHNTKVMNAILEEINFKLKSTLQVDEDVITHKKSDLDKRVKVYAVDESYFLIS